jgi:N-acetylglucosaminyl-diphospho-decaprenol L-rhamnosyltransferase
VSTEPSDHMSDVDIVIVTHNSAHVVTGLLDSLPEALSGLSATVVVVDNDSTDSTVELIHQRGDCRVVQAPNLGYAAGINRGAAEASGAKAILVLNPDTRLGSNSVPRMLSALAMPETGIIAPQVRSIDGALQLSLRRFPTLLRAVGFNRSGIAALAENVIGDRAYNTPHVVDWATGAVLMMSRLCFDALGGWDESFFLYSEETDFCYRARAMGFLTRYEPNSVVVHIGGQSGRSARTHVMQIVNRVRLYRRYNGALASWCFYWLAITRELLWLMRGQPESRAAIAALLRPPLRPPEIGCSKRILPG